jgi:hypothetical protein
MPTEPQPVTVAQVVHRAVEVCADGASEGLDSLLERFEDADQPVTAVPDIERALDEAVGSDPEPELEMARAVAVYLAYRRDELNAPPLELLRLAARAEFGDRPPKPVARWLEWQGVI